MKSLILVFAAFLFGAAVPTSSAPAPEDPLPELRKARLDAAREAYNQFAAKWKKGGVFKEEDRYVWSRRLLEAEKEMAKNHEQIVAAYQAHLDRMIELEKAAKHQVDIGLAKSENVAAAVYFRTEAELDLARAKLKR